MALRSAPLLSKLSSALSDFPPSIAFSSIRIGFPEFSFIGGSWSRCVWSHTTAYITNLSFLSPEVIRSV